MTSFSVIALLKKQFARFCVSNVIISDGGPQFVSQEFQDFEKKWGITHVTSSLMHQQANGKAETAVKVMKTLLEKCEVEKTLMKQSFNKGTHQDRTHVLVQRSHVQQKSARMIPQLQQKFEKPKTLEIARRRNQRRQTVKK